MYWIIMPLELDFGFETYLANLADKPTIFGQIFGQIFWQIFGQIWVFFFMNFSTFFNLFRRCTVFFVTVINLISFSAWFSNFPTVFGFFWQFLAFFWWLQCFFCGLKIRTLQKLIFLSDISFSSGLIINWLKIDKKLNYVGTLFYYA